MSIQSLLCIYFLISPLYTTICRSKLFRVLSDSICFSCDANFCIPCVCVVCYRIPSCGNAYHRSVSLAIRTIVIFLSLGCCFTLCTIFQFMLRSSALQTFPFRSLKLRSLALPIFSLYWHILYFIPEKTSYVRYVKLWLFQYFEYFVPWNSQCLMCVPILMSVGNPSLFPIWHSPIHLNGDQCWS